MYMQFLVQNCHFKPMNLPKSPKTATWQIWKLSKVVPKTFKLNFLKGIFKEITSFLEYLITCWIQKISIYLGFRKHNYMLYIWYISRPRALWATLGHFWPSVFGLWVKMSQKFSQMNFVLACADTEKCLNVIFY